MPEITFYVLNSVSPHEYYFFACRLIEKAYQNEKFCYVMLDSIEQCQRLDDMLWTFRMNSFIPHQVLIETLPELTSQVLIGTQNPPTAWQGIILNLSSQMPQTWQQATRILEILDNNEITKIAARERYKTYQHAGIVCTTHKIAHVNRE